MNFGKIKKFIIIKEIQKGFENQGAKRNNSI